MSIINKSISIQESQLMQQFQTMTIPYIPFSHATQSLNQNERILEEFYQQTKIGKLLKREAQCKNCIFGVKHEVQRIEENILEQTCGICFLKRMKLEMNNKKQKQFWMDKKKQIRDQSYLLSTQISNLANMLDQMQIKSTTGTKKSLIEIILSLFIKHQRTSNLTYWQILKIIRIENLNYQMNEKEVSELRSKVKKAMKSLRNSGLVSYKNDSVHPGSCPVFKLNLDHFPRVFKEALLQKFSFSKVLSEPSQKSALQPKFKIIELLPNLKNKIQVPFQCLSFEKELHNLMRRDLFESI